jgi:hypothetical protein
MSIENSSMPAADRPDNRGNMSGPAALIDMTSTSGASANVDHDADDLAYRNAIHMITNHHAPPPPADETRMTTFEALASPGQWNEYRELIAARQRTEAAHSVYEAAEARDRETWQKMREHDLAFLNRRAGAPEPRGAVHKPRETRSQRRKGFVRFLNKVYVKVRLELARGELDRACAEEDMAQGAFDRAYAAIMEAVRYRIIKQTCWELYRAEESTGRLLRTEGGRGRGCPRLGQRVWEDQGPVPGGPSDRGPPRGGCGPAERSREGAGLGGGDLGARLWPLSIKRRTTRRHSPNAKRLSGLQWSFGQKGLEEMITGNLTTD